MSVTAAKFFGSQSSYAAGAPRSEGTGQVVLFGKRSANDYNDPNFMILKTILVLKGEQFGSSFGYELANADVNGDK